MKVVDIAVDLVDWMGSDLDVVDAARVSFNKSSQMEIVETSYSDEYGSEYEERLSDQDAKLIRYLAKHNHWSPFSHCYLKFRIKAPLFCAAQLKKHTVGLAWNEVSRRYVDSEPEFWLPKEFHGRPDNKKQGSGEVLQASDALLVDMQDYARTALYNYNWLIADGMAPEEARMFLPQSTMTEWIWSGSLYAFARVVNLRTAPDAQKAATQEVAGKIAEFVKQNFPESYEALCVK